MIDTNVQHVPHRRRRPEPHAGEPRARHRLRQHELLRRRRPTAPSRDALRELIVAGGRRSASRSRPTTPRRRSNREPADVLVLIDGSDSTISAPGARRRQRRRARRDRSEVAERAGAQDLPIRAHPLLLFNPDSRSANLLIPGLVAILLTFSGTLLAAFAIVRERERGTLEQLMVTPASPVGGRARQAPALPRLWPSCSCCFVLVPDDGRLPRADPRQPPAAARPVDRLPLRAPLARPARLVPGADADGGDPDRADVPAAVDHAVGLHLPALARSRRRCGSSRRSCPPRTSSRSRAASSSAAPASRTSGRASPPCSSSPLVLVAGSARGPSRRRSRSPAPASDRMPARGGTAAKAKEYPMRSEGRRPRSRFHPPLDGGRQGHALRLPRQEERRSCCSTRSTSRPSARSRTSSAPKCCPRGRRPTSRSSASPSTRSGRTRPSRRRTGIDYPAAGGLPSEGRRRRESTASTSRRRAIAARTAFIIGKDGKIKEVIASDIPVARDIAQAPREGARRERPDERDRDRRRRRSRTSGRSARSPRACRAIIEILGLDLADPNLAETPERVAKMYLEMFHGLTRGSGAEGHLLPERRALHGDGDGEGHPLLLDVLPPLRARSTATRTSPTSRTTRSSASPRCRASSSSTRNGRSSRSG